MRHPSNMPPTTPSYQDHDGYLIASGFPVNNFESALRYKAQFNDLFVVSYPKCGTTLTQHIVYLLLHNGQPISADQRLDRVFPHLEEVGADYVSSKATVAQGFRLIKTHFDYDRTPQHRQAKYIFVVRNPKDCVVSFFHHTKGFPRHYNFEDGSFDTYFDLFMKGRVDHGDYFKVVRSWMDHRLDSNVLLLTYEFMRASPRNSILKIATFLDQKPDSLLIDKILLHSSLESMKRDPLRWCSERSNHHTPFIRSGKVAGWNELLTSEQAERLDSRVREVFSLDERRALGEHYG